MAPPSFNHAVLGETFLPRQIFVFGDFALRANLLGHQEQIDSYAPGHQVRFGNLNYTTDIRGDLIFDGFGPAPGAPIRPFCIMLLYRYLSHYGLLFHDMSQYLWLFSLILHGLS